MKNIFLKSIALSIFLITLSFSVQAQHGKNKDKIREKVKTQKIAFISEKLELSELEAQKFWPIYDAYQSDLRQLKSTLSLHPRENLTDKEADDMMNAYLDGKSKEIDIQRKYIEKLKTAIPPRKVANLFRVEREFKEKIVSSIKRHHKEE